MTVTASLVIAEVNNQLDVSTPMESEGFGTPDIVLFWCGDFTNNDNSISTSYQNSFGWALPGGIQRCISVYSSHNNSLSSTSRQSDPRYIFVTGASDYQAAWTVSFTTDGVSLRGARNTGASRNYPVYALLLKGVIASFDGVILQNDGFNQTINCGFKPDLVIGSHIGFNQVANMEQPVNEQVYGIGFANETTQRSICASARTSQNPMDNCLSRHNLFAGFNFTTVDTPIWTVSCENFTDTGFDLVTTPGSGTANDAIFFLALDFGPGITSEILDGFSRGGAEESLNFSTGSVILGMAMDALTADVDVLQKDLNHGVSHWIAYPGREASIAFSNEDGVGIQNTRTGRWSTELRGLSHDGVDVWTGTSDFINGKPRMGFKHANRSGVYFMGVSFGTPGDVNKLWMGDIKPNLYMGDDQVDRVYMGDELVWVKD